MRNKDKYIRLFHTFKILKHNLKIYGSLFSFDSRNEIQASSFYTEFKNVFKQSINHGQNKDSNELQPENSTKKDCTNCQKVLQDIVCYGVGCIRTCPNARYQLALLILLKEYLKVNSYF